MRDFVGFLALFSAMGTIGCSLGMKVVHQRDEFRVYNSRTGEECLKQYTEFDGSSVVYSYGRDCNVLLRYRLENKLLNFKDIQTQ